MTIDLSVYNDRIYCFSRKVFLTETMFKTCSYCRNTPTWCLTGSKLDKGTYDYDLLIILRKQKLESL